MMRKPTYMLTDVQARVRELGRKAFTSTAIDTAQDELGMTVEEVINFICSRTDTLCYKTMKSQKLAGAIWMYISGSAQTVLKWPISKFLYTQTAK